MTHVTRTTPIGSIIWANGFIGKFLGFESCDKGIHTGDRITCCQLEVTALPQSYSGDKQVGSVIYIDELYCREWCRIETPKAGTINCSGTHSINHEIAERLHSYQQLK